MELKKQRRPNPKSSSGEEIIKIRVKKENEMATKNL
jgi:hypothetical protein